MELYGLFCTLVLFVNWMAAVLLGLLNFQWLFVWLGGCVSWRFGVVWTGSLGFMSPGCFLFVAVRIVVLYNFILVIRLVGGCRL